jgi:hypothetical protein
MKLGFFIMPVHPAGRDYYRTLGTKLVRHGRANLLKTDPAARIPR